MSERQGVARAPVGADPGGRAAVRIPDKRPYRAVSAAPFPVLSPDAAKSFAASWTSAWNRHDLEAIMAHYAETIEHSSPFIARYNDDPTCAPLRGKPNVAAYFARALARNPDLRFDLLHVAVGVDAVALAYRRMTGELAVETFLLGAQGLVVRSTSHYGT